MIQAASGYSIPFPGSQPQFEGGLGWWRLRRQKPTEVKPPQASASVPPADQFTPAQPPALFETAGPDTKATSTKTKPEKPTLKVNLSELIEAVNRNDTAYFDKLFEQRPATANRPNPTLFLQDKGQQFRLTLMKGPDDKRLIWFDFCGSVKESVLKQLADKFTLAPFQEENPENNNIPYDVPVIDNDSIQMTVYCMSLRPQAPNNPKDDHTTVVADQKLYLYAGENFFITTHDQKRPSVDKTLSLLLETGTFKTPAELMVFIVNENLNRYGHVISSLRKDISRMTAKLSEKKVDESIMADSLEMNQKIDTMFGNIIRQQQVLKRLLELNKFYHSKFVQTKDVQRLLREIDHHLQVLDHYQDQKKGLEDIKQAKLSNELNHGMRRATALGILAIPTTAMGALMGMNVPIPGGDEKNMFAWLAGGAAAATGSIYLLLKRRKWL
jgi:Mg2+ and Co2+ transporter CorA